MIYYLYNLSDKQRMEVNMTKEKGLSGSTLKIIAILVMIVDHIGLGIWSRLPGLGYLVPDVMDRETWWLIYNVMRSIGRTAFPIFAFLLVEGFFHTKNRLMYAIRLFSFAFISQIPFHYAFLHLTSGLNIFFTLFIGLIMMWAMTEIKKRWPNIFLLYRKFLRISYTIKPSGGCTLARMEDVALRPRSARGFAKANPSLYLIGWIIIIAAAGFTAYQLKTDYYYQGILVIAIFYILREQRILALSAGYLTFLLPQAIKHDFTIQLYCLVGFILSWFYNGNRGLKIKYLFYMVYPAHLLLIYVIWRYII
jgi:hypothetical protein